MENKKQFITEMLLSSAHGFYNSGWQQAKMIGRDNLLIQKLAPAMMNFSFSIELLLKGLQYTTTGQSSNVHSFVKLFNNLTKLDRYSIETTFNEMKIKTKESDKLPAFLFQITRKTDYDSNNTNQADKEEDFYEFLKLHDNSFENWRYFFEFNNINKVMPANLHLMDCFARALIAVASIKGFKPTIFTNMPKIY